MFQTNVAAKIKTRILYSITFFKETRAVYEVMWKKKAQPIRSQIKYDTARALCMLDSSSYRHAFRTRNISCFYATKIVMRRRLNVTCVCTWPVFLFSLV